MDGPIETIRKKLPNQRQIRKFGIDLIFAVIACAIGAFSIMAVMIPNGLASGGTTGIARIIQDNTSIDYAFINYGLTLLILIITWIFLGFREVRKIIVMSILFPAMLYVFEHLIRIQLLESEDILLASIFCGVITGISTGIAFSRGYSFGGTDTVAKIIRRTMLPHISQTKIMTTINVIIIAGCAFAFGRNIALYALITQWIIGETADLTIHGFKGSIVQIQIITTNKEGVCDYILNELNRGVSVHEVEGGYSGITRSELRLLCSPREELALKKELREIDPHAFTTVLNVDNVWGKGFDPLGK